MSAQVIKTAEALVLSTGDGIFIIRTTSPIFEKVNKLFQNRQYDKIEEIADFSKKINLWSKKKILVVDGEMYIDDARVPVDLTKTIFSFADNDIDPAPLLNLWDNIQKNPQPESIVDLYSFLSANNVPITEDGCFIAYKRVDDNFRDLQTHTFDNSPGQTVKMDRKDVVLDREITCASGLHAAAYQYAKDFYKSGRLVEVKINPINVVSVPIDYDQQKMRVCEYEVIRECEEEYTKPLYTATSKEHTEYSDYEDEDDMTDQLDYCDEDCANCDVENCDDRNENYYNEDEDEDEDKDKDYNEDDVSSDFIDTVIADSLNRIRISASSSKYAGFMVGDKVNLFRTGDKWILTQSSVTIENEDEDIEYIKTVTVDCYRNIRLSVSNFPLIAVEYDIYAFDDGRIDGLLIESA